MEINRITGAIIDSAMKVHSAFGPGLLESAYKACLVYELRKRGFRVDVEVALPLIYDGVKLEEIGYRLDLLVENEVVVELKAVEILAPIFEVAHSPKELPRIASATLGACGYHCQAAN